MGGLFSSPNIPDPKPAPAPPSRSDKEVRDAATRTRLRMANATGREKTIATSGQGVKPEDESSPAIMKLLGE